MKNYFGHKVEEREGSILINFETWELFQGNVVFLSSKVNVSWIIHAHLKMRTLCCFGSSVPDYILLSSYHVSDEWNSQLYRCKNLKAHIDFIKLLFVMGIQITTSGKHCQTPDYRTPYFGIVTVTAAVFGVIMITISSGSNNILLYMWVLQK